MLYVAEPYPISQEMVRPGARAPGLFYFVIV